MNEKKSGAVSIFIGLLLIVIFGVGLAVDNNPMALIRPHSYDFALERESTTVNKPRIQNKARSFRIALFQFPCSAGNIGQTLLECKPSITFFAIRSVHIYRLIGSLGEHQFSTVITSFRTYPKDGLEEYWFSV